MVSIFVAHVLTPPSTTLSRSLSGLAGTSSTGLCLRQCQDPIIATTTFEAALNGREKSIWVTNTLKAHTQKTWQYLSVTGRCRGSEHALTFQRAV